MAFDTAAPSRSATRRTKKELILGVGWHAFVNWPHPADPVPVLDAAAGTEVVPNRLADGQEVEVLSWRPRSREGLVYQIRNLGDGSEWWILASHLRRGREPEPVATPPTEAQVLTAAAARSSRSGR